MKPASAATYERAHRLANIALWTIDMQCRRLRTAEVEDEHFVFRKWADFDFLIVALTRLRRAAELASSVPEVAQHLTLALSQFDAALPGLKTLRDVAEHIDEYAMDEGRRKAISRKSLEVSTLSRDGSTLEWLGHRLNADESLRASQDLFQSIQWSRHEFKAFTSGCAVNDGAGDGEDDNSNQDGTSTL